MKCWWAFFHNWNKWTDVTVHYTNQYVSFGVKIGEPIEYQVEMQMRECKDCGRKQTRKIK